MKRRDWLGLVAFLALTFGTAAIGSQFMPGEWYERLAKPEWTPPNRVFGPVWTVLYALIALAGWLVWRERGIAGARVALALYLLQLALNAAWSWLFFGLERPGAALVEIAVLWCVILATALAFRRVRRLAAVLLLPYLLWVSFASALNFAIWRLN